MVKPEESKHTFSAIFSDYPGVIKIDDPSNRNFVLDTPLLRRFLLKCLPILGFTLLMSAPSIFAHDGKDDDYQPSAPVSLEINGLQNAYQENQPIKGMVTIQSKREIDHAQLTIKIFDPDQCTPAGVCPAIYDKSFKVEDDGYKRKPISFSLKKGAPVTAYTVQATLTTGLDSRSQGEGKGVEKSCHKRVVLAEAQTRFGVRQASMSGVPDNILKGDVSPLDVNALKKQLQKCSKEKTVTELVLAPGNKVKVRVDQVQVLAQGVQIPGMKTPPVTYRGQIVKEDGRLDQDSVVDLHIINGTLSGSIIYGRQSGKLDEVREETFIDPESSYHEGLTSNKHIIFKHRHSVAPDAMRLGSHPQPETAYQSPPLTAAPSFGNKLLTQLKSKLDTIVQSFNSNDWYAPFLSSANAADPTDERYTLRVAAFQHFVSNSRTENRYATLVRALNQMLVEFQNVSPMLEDGHVQSDRLMSMSTYQILTWTNIPKDNSYFDGVDRNEATGEEGDTCNNINVFNSKGLVPPGDNALRILFTYTGGGTPGCAQRGSYTTVINDNFSSSWNWFSIVVMQELGHNMDRRFGGDNSPSYDPHIASLISEKWTYALLDGCTAMRASYDGCDYDFLYYARDSYLAPRQRLIYGLEFVSNRDFGWRDVTGSGPRLRDIAASDEFGDVWGIGRDNVDSAGNGGIFKLVDGSWVRNPNSAGVRIALDSQGIPWVVTASGRVFKKTDNDVNNATYNLLPDNPSGATSDIAMSRAGIPNVIGKIGGDGNGPIYQSGDGGNTWTQIPGTAKRIAVVDEEPWVVTNAGLVFRHVPGTFISVPASGVSDIASGGAAFSSDPQKIYITGAAGSTYVYEPTYNSWRILPRPLTAFDIINGDNGGGIAITADTLGPWLVNNPGIAIAPN